MANKDEAQKIEFAESQAKPGVTRGVWDGGPFTAVRYSYEPGAAFPSHSHDSAQLTIVLTGRIRFTIQGHSLELGPGDSAYIPGGVPHSAEVPPESETVVSINVFHPPRKEHP